MKRGEDESMPEKRYIRVQLESIKVNSNGDLPGEKSSEKNNAIIGTLMYPRPGAPSIVSTIQQDLQNDTVVDFPQGDFFKSGLFKEEVFDETRIVIKVTNREEASKLEKFLLKAFSAALSGGIGVATGGLSSVILGAVIPLIVKSGTSDLVAAGEEQIAVIGEATLDVPEISKLKPGLHTLPLIAPKTITKRRFVLKQGGKAVEQEVTLVKEGAKNGEVRLRITVA